MNPLKQRIHIERFLLEDIGDQDVTSSTIFSQTDIGTGRFVAKSAGVISGLGIIKATYQLLDATIIVHEYVCDGDVIQQGDIIAEVKGPIAHLLTGERVILNLIQRMSGIATVTNNSIETLNDPTIRICDTRKTAPGLRMFDKYAVRTGGGRNHRQGLSDGVLIKDNHISYCGSITKAIQTVRNKIGHMIKIEVETETKAEVEEAVAGGADIIMFDNRLPNEVKQFTKIVPKHIITEASGGISLYDLATYADTGVDYISLGFITHSVQAIDISLQVNEEDKI